MGRRKKRRISGRAKHKQRLRIKRKMGKHVPFTLINCRDRRGSFADSFYYKANLHNVSYANAAIENVKFQASSLTKCTFRSGRLRGIDFFHSSLRGTTFKNASLIDVVFFNCNLKGVDFQGATFKRVAFICTNTDIAKRFTLNSECTVYKTYPRVCIDSFEKDSLLALSQNRRIYKYGVLHVSKQKLNLWVIKLLTDCYGDIAVRALLMLKYNQEPVQYFTTYSYKKYIENFIKQCYDN